MMVDETGWDALHYLPILAAQIQDQQGLEMAFLEALDGLGAEGVPSLCRPENGKEIVPQALDSCLQDDAGAQPIGIHIAEYLDPSA